MYENAFNNIEKTLRAEAGIANELDYVEQISWVLFLKYLHDLESERKDRAELEGSSYQPILSGDLRWDQWAWPEVDGELDKDAKIGDDLITFVDRTLFDVLAYIMYTLPPLTRQQRADAVNARTLSHGNDEMAVFLHKILLSYVQEGEGQLETEKLGDLLKATYGSVSESKDRLGEVAVIKQTFLGLQQELYRF